MNKEFVSYTQALALKELGFDEECLKLWEKTMLFTTLVNPEEFKRVVSERYTLAPLYQQAFRWFREKYDITQTIARDGSLAKEGRWAYTIIADLIYFNDGYFTYEEAESACLDKLIEICKAKTNEQAD